MNISYLLLCVLFFVSIYGEELASVARKATKTPKASKTPKALKASKDPKASKAPKAKVAKVPKGDKSTKVSVGNYKVPLSFEYDCDTTDPPPTTSLNLEPALLQYHEFVNEESNQGFTSIGITVANQETSECTPSIDGNGRRLLRGFRRTFVVYNLFAFCFGFCPDQALPDIPTANRQRFLQVSSDIDLLNDVVPYLEQFKLIFRQQLDLTVTQSTTNLEETRIIDCSQRENCNAGSNCCGTSDCTCSEISESLCRVNACDLPGCCESFNELCFSFPSCSCLSSQCSDRALCCDNNLFRNCNTFCSDSTSSPTPFPINFPTRSPTSTPTRLPTNVSTRSPTRIPTKSPTMFPTRSPTKFPTVLPSLSPTYAPTLLPSSSPTITFAPFQTPSTPPTITSEPSQNLSTSPTITQAPTLLPSSSPTVTFAPFQTPSTSPTITSEPSQNLSTSPTITQQPSMNPTETSCLFLCLDEITQDDCPNDFVSLKSCHIAAVDNLCITERPCEANEGTSQCGLAFYVYRKIPCPIDMPWRQVSNGFEYYVETLRMDWLSHGQRANQYNASLTSIHSQAEMNLMINMIQNISYTMYYVGGSRRGIAGDPWTDGTSSFWEWTDQTPWDFTLWAIGEPDGQSIDNNVRESVVVLQNSRMHDTFSTLNYPAVYRRRHNNPQIMELPQTLGFEHSCALQNKTNIYCWGRNVRGQLGDGSTTNRLIPTMINFGDGRTITQLVIGHDHTCAVLDNGVVKCWGRNSEGQLGDGSTLDRPTPTTINFGGGRTVTQLALGAFHSCALLDNGVVKCWGLNSYSQLGDNSYTNRLLPTEINVSDGRTVTQIALGNEHSCALLDNGVVKCWGRNHEGQLGDGSRVDRPTPTTINFGGGRTVTHLVLGAFHSCVVLDNNAVKCWGDNYHVQLGDGSTTDRLIPTTINVSDGRNITQLAIGAYHNFAILDDGVVKCWGLNREGQLGDGSTTDRHTPTTINFSGERTVTQLALGVYHSCAVLDDDVIKCWGYNNFGQLGDESFTNRQNASSVDSLLFYT